MDIIPDPCTKRLEVRIKPDPDAPDKQTVTWWDEQQARNRRSLYVALAVVATLLAAWFGVSEFLKHKTPLSGPADTWANQLAAAQAATDKDEPGAVLIFAGADPYLVRGPSYSTTLIITFVFSRISGRGTEETVEDTSPAFIQKVETDKAALERNKITYEELTNLKKDVATIKLSPRQALEQTLGEAKAFATGNGEQWTNPEISLFFRRNLSGKDHVPGNSPTLWRVQHFTFGNVNKELSFWIDASTGAILDRQVDSFPEPATPVSP